MPWWTFGLGKKPPHVSRETVEALKDLALTAAATTVRSPQSSFLPSVESWQREVWGYYDSLGEFQYAVDWKSRMMSRVRLFAARIDPDQDEPVRIEDDSLAVQLVASLGGALGQSTLLDDLNTQLDVPGEGYVIAETVGGREVWSVRSTEEIRKRSGLFEVVSEDPLELAQDWRPLAPDHLIMRVYKPHKRRHSVANSSARAARGTMRELELVNRHIVSQYLSRLASAGVVIFPEEVTFPVREEFADAPDPFVAEWIEIAAQAIKEPGTASAVIPIPMKIPGEWLGKIQHIDFTLQIDEKIIEKRESAIRRLATQVNIPAEILTGMGDVNHWGAWMIEEGALKTTIAPDAELICAALTNQYLQPRLAASGEEDADQIVVWYDMSELAVRPDRSANAVTAYDRQELSGTALRREGGFDEADKPTQEELREMALKVMLRTQPDAAVFEELTGDSLGVEQSEATAMPEETGNTQGDRSAPEEATPQEVPTDASALRTERLIRQAQAGHAIRFTGTGQWQLLHPVLCEKHAYSCPYTQAALDLRTTPGRSGLYECVLNAFGELRIGEMSPHMDPSSFFPTRSSNGHGSRG